MIEAKAWDKPFISRRLDKIGAGFDYRDLIAQTVQHWKNAGQKDKSPASPLWHEYLEQVGGYVKNLVEKYEHALPRVALTSGAWLVIFKRPVVSFCSAGHSHHCAHQGLQDRKAQRCQISAFDERICCSACSYRALPPASEVSKPPAEKGRKAAPL
jgi:hypothetical protein